MRWIVITLLVLNAAYFGWSFSQPESEGASVASVAALDPLEGKPLVLLTERLPAKESGAPPPAPMVVTETTPVHREVEVIEVKKQAMCVSVGPFEEEKDGRTLIKNLAVEGVASNLDALQLSKETQYWVILPAAASRKEALETLRKLQSKRIDSYLISTGEMRNAISLGLFSKEQSAKGVLASVKEAGFPAQLEQKERVKSEFWVRIAPGQPLENLQETLETLVVAGGDTKISKVACEMFAQSK